MHNEGIHPSSAPAAPGAPTSAPGARRASVAKPGTARLPQGGSQQRGQRLLNAVRAKIQFQTSVALTIKTALPLLQRVKPAASAELGQLLVCAPVVGAALSVWDAATCLQRVGEDVAQQHAMYRTGLAKAEGARAFREASSARRQLLKAARPQPSDAAWANWDAQRADQKAQASTHAVTLLEAEANAAKAAMPRARRLITALGAVRDVPLQLVRTVLGIISFAPSVGGSAALAATVPSPVSPVLGIASGLINITQGLLEWRHARAGEVSHRRMLRHAAGLRNGDQFDWSMVNQRARHIKGSTKEIAHADPAKLDKLYAGIHTHFEQAHQRSLATAQLGKLRAAMQIAFGALTTPLGAASLGLALAGAAAGTGGIALLVLPLVGAVLGIGWLVYLQRRGAASDKAAAAELEHNARQRAELQQLLKETGGAIDAIEQRFLAAAEHGAGTNKYVAAHLLAHHLSNTKDGAQRTLATRYLLAIGMARDTVSALKRLPRGAQQFDRITQAIEAHLLDGARPVPPSGDATQAQPAPLMAP